MNIGIFDSGIGGINLLSQALKELPKENYIFYADTEHVPYGTRTKEEIIGFVADIIDFMKVHDCKAVVIACNTATAAAVKIMRERYDLPIIGIEPAVKPAVESSKGKRVMVIATPLTIKEEKLKNLVARVDDTHLVDMEAFPGLVEFAEKREFTGEKVETYIREKLSGYNLDDYSEFVLGCTHFNFFKDTMRKVLPEGISIIDGSLGTIKQLKRVLENRGLLETNNTSKIDFYYSGKKADSEEELRDFEELLKRSNKMSEIV